MTAFRLTLFLASAPLCFWSLHELALRRRWLFDWRLVFVTACVLWGSLLTLIVEFASLVGLVNPTGLLGWWGLTDGLLFMVAAKCAQARGTHAARLVAEGWQRLRRHDAAAWPWDVKWFACFITALGGFLFGLALITPTTNWDSLTYHLPRFLQWIQQGSVEHFATNNPRQIEFGPWNSYLLMQLYLFAGGDRLLNLAQWGAMAGTLVVTTLLARQLAMATGLVSPDDTGEKARRILLRAGAVSCLLVITLPTGIVESITTQNDYVTSFWMMCLMALGLELMRGRAPVLLAGAAGLALGLGILTKATAYLYAGPALVLIGPILCQRVEGWKARGASVAVFAGAVLLLNGPHWIRNTAIFGSPLGSPEIFQLERNQRCGVDVTASNLIRHTALNANTGIPVLTRALYGVLTTAHRLTGLSASDPATTYAGTSCVLPEHLRFYDNYASSAWHVFIFLVAGGVAVCAWRRYGRLFWVAVPAGLSLLLLCGYVRWQPWATRLHLALFLMVIPAAGLVLASNRLRWLTLSLGMVVQVFAVICILLNDSRPLLNPEFFLLSRESQCIILQPKHVPFITATAERIARCRHIGFKLDFDDPEYPLWLALRNRGFAGRVTQEFVNNPSAALAVPGQPEVIVSSILVQPPRAMLERYPRRESIGYHQIYWPESTQQRAEASRQSKP